MSELTPSGISNLDLAAFLIDARLATVRDTMFSLITDEDLQVQMAALFRVAYAAGLGDSQNKQITNEIKRLGFKFVIK